MTKTAEEILAKHVNANGGKLPYGTKIFWVIQAMEEYKNQPKSLPTDISDFIEKEFPYPENDLYKPDDPDLEQMIWAVNQKREAFTLCYNTYVEPLKEENIELQRGWDESHAAVVRLEKRERDLEAKLNQISNPHKI